MLQSAIHPDQAVNKGALMPFEEREVERAVKAHLKRLGWVRSQRSRNSWWPGSDRFSQTKKKSDRSA